MWDVKCEYKMWMWNGNVKWECEMENVNVKWEMWMISYFNTIQYYNAER